jgi:hypothetical protein
MARIDPSVVVYNSNLLGAAYMHPALPPPIEMRGADLSLLSMMGLPPSPIERIHSSSNEKRNSPKNIPMKTESSRARGAPAEESNTKTAADRRRIRPSTEALSSSTIATEAHQRTTGATQTPAEEEALPEQIISSKWTPSTTTQPATRRGSASTSTSTRCTNKKPAKKVPSCRANKHSVKKTQQKSTAASPKNKPKKLCRLIPAVKNYVDDEMPTEVDVLCGRGGGSNYHGNQRYWLKVLELRPAYVACGKNNNEEKTQIAQRVVDHIEENKGRFLEAKQRRESCLFCRRTLYFFKRSNKR